MRILPRSGPRTASMLALAHLGGRFATAPRDTFGSAPRVAARDVITNPSLPTLECAYSYKPTLTPGQELGDVYDALGVTPYNVIQGLLDDSAFGAVVISLSVFDGLLPEIVTIYDVNGNSTQTMQVTLYQADGTPTVVTIDDQIPMADNPDQPGCFAQMGFGIFEGTYDNLVLYVSLLEKAVAQISGNAYSALVAPSPSAFLQILTGTGGTDFGRDGFKFGVDDTIKSAIESADAQGVPCLVRTHLANIVPLWGQNYDPDTNSNSIEGLGTLTAPPEYKDLLLLTDPNGVATYIDGNITYALMPPSDSDAPGKRTLWNPSGFNVQATDVDNIATIQLSVDAIAALSIIATVADTASLVDTSDS